MRNNARTDTKELAQRCREEANRSRTRESGPEGSCFELFRRAVVGKCQEAWQAVYAQYHGLVIYWIGKDADDAEDLVHCAFEKFWKATGQETFARFAGLASVLAYLRRCARSVHIDRWRRMKRECLALDELRENNPSSSNSSEPKILDDIVNQRCVKHINGRLKDEQERLVVYLSFELDLKPSEIAQQYTAQFFSAHDVSRVKERVVRRLSQDPILREMWNR